MNSLFVDTTCTLTVSSRLILIFERNLLSSSCAATSVFKIAAVTGEGIEFNA